MPKYTEGIAVISAAILKDGIPVSVSEVITELNRVSALEEVLRKAKYEKSIMDSAAIEDNEAYIQRLERAIKELLSQDISEQYIHMVRKNTTAEELLEEERDSLRSKVEELEKFLFVVMRSLNTYGEHPIIEATYKRLLGATCQK